MTHRIAIVDDDEALVFMLKESLSSDGFDVVTASDGPGALELFKTDNPKLLIIDSNMPGMSGQAVLAALRADGVHQKLPVILLTGDAPEKALPGGANAITRCLTKPVELDALTTLVTQMASA